LGDGQIWVSIRSQESKMSTLASLRPLLVLADAGIPMIFVTWPAMVIALVPVIALEALLIRKRVPYEPWQIVRATAAANLFSTIIGIPLTWLGLVAFEMVIGFAVSLIPGIQHWHGPVARAIGFIFAVAWLPPFGVTRAAIPLAALVLLIPFYFVSVWSERLVMKRMLQATSEEVAPEGGVSKKRLWRAVRDANLLSYGFLVFVTSMWLIWRLGD
jgi:hypothetical protein